MNLYVINTGFFKLDGGAMFGVVPKSIWQKLNPADEKNLCTWAMRCLLVQDGDKLMLIDNGIGDKQDQKFLSHYHLHGEDSMKKSLHAAGFHEKEITDMFLTHLHFDHCGGGVRKEGERFVPVFPDANYWTSKDHWHWAIEPNVREKPSFLKENILPMQSSGQLQFVDSSQASPLPGMEIFFASGHTEKMMIPMIRFKGKTLCFMADLIPSHGHIPLPYIMAYDVRPLVAFEEKARFLEEAADKGYILFFEHDPVYECCTVTRTEKGIRMERSFPLSEIL